MTVPKGYGKGHLNSDNAPNSPIPNDNGQRPKQRSPPLEPGVGEAKPENTKTSGSKINEETSKSTLDPKKDETESAKKGEPIGEFKGRGNLWAFMQVKDWDSDASQTPDADIT